MKTFSLKVLRYIFLLFSLILILPGCREDESDQNPDSLHGYWINPVYSGQEITFMRSNSFRTNEYGIYFKENRKLVERKNSGWCATPPVSYADYEGTWKQNGNRVLLHLSYWGGWMDVEWQIVSQDEEFLNVKVIEQDSD